MIFVDEDFKQKIGDVNVLWGVEYQNIQQFNYEQITPGIYFTQIEDDMSRFTFVDDQPVQKIGGVIVGNVDAQDIHALPVPLDKFLIKQV